MTTTNKYNLPDPLYKALIPNRRKPVKGRIGVTDLINAPLQRMLKMQHFEMMEDDASENLWALLGKAIHYVIEQEGNKDTSEVKKEFVHPSGATLVTVGDYISKEGELVDWKVTSVWAFLLGTKIDWIRQLNCVKYIYEKNGIYVKDLHVNAILRDWMKSKTFENNYPPIGTQSINIPIYDSQEIESYINERVALHLAAENMDISDIPQCSPEERWQRPTTYAVMKPKLSRAVRVFPTKEEAEKYIGSQKLLSIVERKGVDGKCEIYCPVNKFCKYFSPTLVQSES